MLVLSSSPWTLVCHHGSSCQGQCRISIILFQYDEISFSIRCLNALDLPRLQKWWEKAEARLKRWFFTEWTLITKCFRLFSGEAQVQLNCTKSAKPLTHWTVNQLSANSCSEWWRQGVFWNEIAAHFLCFKLIVHACQTPKYICLFHIKVLVICWQQHRDNYGHVLCKCLFHGNWTLQYHEQRQKLVCVLNWISVKWPCLTLCHFWWNAMICLC